MPSVKFRISSALKTIIGKELITDDFIAVFELVKNSFDAQAKRVDITFDSLRTKDAKIVIQDNGEGMDRNDISHKWLFVAYSARKKQQDYRDKINSGRILAGAKGIGRFSCDRLGEQLKVYTKKKGGKGGWHILEVDWSDFELDSQKEFQDIPARYTTANTIPYAMSHGTVLEITGLRSKDWDRDKLLKLRRSLERLVNPNQENDSTHFAVYLQAPEEKEQDRSLKQKAKQRGKEVEEWKLVNGLVKNFLFETLKLKTAQVNCHIAPNGNAITTRLEDRGILIYELTERNPYQETLRNIDVHLFALNLSSKLIFKNRMGVSARDYGSVFLYKNGFRINPFGNPDDDNLGINRRHQQGFYRYLGTRDVSGRIEINGANEAFQETSSRDGGLIKNKAFYDLQDFIIEFPLKRLEKFFIDLSKFGHERGELPDAKTLSKAEVKQAIFDIVVKLTQSKDVIEFKYDPKFLDILKNRSAESVSALMGNFKRIAAEQKSPALAKEVAKAERQLKRLEKAKDEAEKGEERERKRAKKAEAEAREAQAKAEEAEEAARKAVAAEQDARYREQQLDTQNVFLKGALSKDLTHVITLHHSIGQDAITIEQYVNNLLTLLKGSTPPRLEQLKVPLERISLVAKKILAISRFATRASDAAAKEELTSDLIEYVREYLLNVHGGAISDPYRNPIAIRFHQPSKAAFVTTFTPIDISIVFDNLLSNARKHKVKNIDVAVVECSATQLVFSFADDGAGIQKRNLPHLFDLGFSTTDGSGLGLHHIREIMTEMNGSIVVSPERKPGAEFLLTFPKR